jgi:hypothetical protein
MLQPIEKLCPTFQLAVTTVIPPSPFSGIVIFRHNEIRYELVDMAGRALTPSEVRNEPLIADILNGKTELDSLY